MPNQQEQEIVLEDFSGGLNLLEPESKIEDNELIQAQNIEVDLSGLLIGRPGVQWQFDNNSIINLLGFFTTSSEQYLVYLEQTSSNNDRGIFVFRSPDTQERHVLDGIQDWQVTINTESTYDPFRYGQIHQYGDKLYVTGFKEEDLYLSNLIEIDDSGLVLNHTNVGNTGDVGSCAKVFKDRLFMAIENRLWFSDPGALMTFDSTNFIDFINEDSTDIVALEVLNDVLFIFKENTIYGLYIEGEPVDWVVRTFETGIGCVGRRAISVVDNIMYFISKRGIFRTDGVNFDNIGTKVFNKLKANNSIVFNISGEDSKDIPSQVIQYDNRIIFVLPESINTARVFVYNFLLEVWTEWVTDNVTSDNVEIFQFAYDSVGEWQNDSTLYGVSPGNGVFLFDDNLCVDVIDVSDTLSNYIIKVIPKKFNFNTSRYKNLKFLGIELKGFTVSAQLTADNETPTNQSLLTSANSALIPESIYKLKGPDKFIYLEILIEAEGGVEESAGETVSDSSYERRFRLSSLFMIITPHSRILDKKSI